MASKSKRITTQKDGSNGCEVIEIDYAPFPIWRNTLHPVLDKYKVIVLVAHRRFGKTVGLVNHIIKEAIISEKQSPQLAYVAPFFTQAKKIAWEYLKYYTSKIPGRKVNESDHFIELPTKHPNTAGAKIYLIGADNPDSLRGTYWDVVVLDEYAQMKDGLYSSIIAPALMDRDGQVIFIGTPNGQDGFYDMYKKALENPNWYAALYSADLSGRFTKEQLADVRSKMKENDYLREFMCSFEVSGDDILITVNLFEKAINRVLKPSDVNGAVKYIGVDVARFGDDRTVITKREGLAIYPPIIIENIDNMTLASRVAAEIRTFKADAVFIDAGRGEGVIDRLRQIGFDQIYEVNFGGKATNGNYYHNKTSEMYDKLKKWITAGGTFPDVVDGNESLLRKELTMRTYEFTDTGKLKVEQKKAFKKRLKFSPDIADSLALTFAEQVEKRDENEEYYGNNQQQEYDPYNDYN